MMAGFSGPSESMTFTCKGRPIKVTGYPTLAEAEARFFAGAMRLSIEVELKRAAGIAAKAQAVGMEMGAKP